MVEGFVSRAEPARRGSRKIGAGNNQSRAHGVAEAGNRRDDQRPLPAPSPPTAAPSQAAEGTALPLQSTN
jgi:hypothetical protein